VRDADTGLQHHAGNASDRNVRSYSSDVHEYKCAIEYIQLPAFEEDKRHAILQRYWADWR